MQKYEGHFQVYRYRKKSFYFAVQVCLLAKYNSVERDVYITSNASDP